MKLPYVLAAVGSNGRVFAKKEIENDDLKAYLCDMEIDLVKEKGYNISFFPVVFEKDIKTASTLGVRPIPHSTEQVSVSRQLCDFISKMVKLPKDYVIVTTHNGRTSEYRETSRLVKLITEEKMRFKENTGIMP